MWLYIVTIIIVFLIYLILSHPKELYLDLHWYSCKISLHAFIISLSPIWFQPHQLIVTFKVTNELLVRSGGSFSLVILVDCIIWNDCVWSPPQNYFLFLGSHPWLSWHSPELCILRLLFCQWGLIEQITMGAPTHHVKQVKWVTHGLAFLFFKNHLPLIYFWGNRYVVMFSSQEVCVVCFTFVTST